ncbi:MAG: threonylcarbamoyl-AMP synthase [Candidatus Sungbacteria bacterium]|uniref:L-threonylcarbamoyladenylate synthase n=1 Tax=Candidatus Sungiibacteriota bacterium TaxID=2750080 RepID=A0A931SBZ8_9BACT|nr:threonylcarbamoyl-AMP synthase [Candidatus Sungbacteria bacterium]
MNVIQLNEKTHHGVLFEAVRVVKAGGVICYPTDTIYGLGGNALEAGVARRIRRIKKRPEEKGMIILVRDVTMARMYAYIDLWTETLLGDLWPGPITVVLQKKDTMPDIVSGGKETIALRMPHFLFVNELAKQIDFPLIATSANVSGDSNQPRTLASFLAAMRSARYKPDLAIDAGELPNHEPSTVLDLTNRKNPVILRHGVLSKSDLDQMLAKHL